MTIILHGSISKGMATVDSDVDVVMHITDARPLDIVDSELWTLAGGICDATYLDSLEYGYLWANKVSDPMVDNPLQPSEHTLDFFEGIAFGIFSTSYLITSVQLLDLIKSLKKGVAPEPVGIPWVHSSLKYGGQKHRDLRNEMIIHDRVENYMSHREITAKYYIGKTTVVDVLRRAHTPKSYQGPRMRGEE